MWVGATEVPADVSLCWREALRGETSGSAINAIRVAAGRATSGRAQSTNRNRRRGNLALPTFVASFGNDATRFTDYVSSVGPEFVNANLRNVSSWVRQRFAEITEPELAVKYRKGRRRERHLVRHGLRRPARFGGRADRPTPLGPSSALVC